MEVLKDLNDKFDNLSEKYSEIANKESTENLLNRIDEISDEIGDINQTITDFNTEIENGRIMSKDDFYSYTTNCVTSIPQDIKLELTDGTLKLKSGSKVYMPNGTGIFNIINVNSDKTFTYSTNGKYIIVLTINGDMNRCSYPAVSGNTEPTASAGTLWYDTANNLVKRNDGTQWQNRSFPVAVITVSNGVISSIDQVFNGFGYVGSTVFVLPGVKVLAPNSLYNNGLLNNILWTTSGVITYTQITELETANVVINTTNGSLDLGNYTYNSDTNYNYYNGSISNGIAIVGSITFSSGIITSAEFKKVFSIKLN